MKILVTAGATQVQIDKVRVISNIFKGTTGSQIAQYFCNQNHQVTLLTSNPELVKGVDKLNCCKFKTFEDLATLMEKEITSGSYDVIIHSAAVSDYKSAGVFIEQSGQLQPLDASQKVSSSHEQLFVKLEPTYKLVDQIRQTWGFSGQLVKFKLQVGLSDEELIRIAQASRQDSSADWIVANCLEWAKFSAYIISAHEVTRVSRLDLAAELYRRLVK